MGSTFFAKYYEYLVKLPKKLMKNHKTFRRK